MNGKARRRGGGDLILRILKSALKVAWRLAEEFFFGGGADLILKLCS